MTSGNFSLIPVSSITVDRDNRQRTELTDIEELAASIAKNGLIHPIIVTKEHELVAGERRFTAHQYLGFETIAVQYAEDLDERQLYLIELEENVRRKDLSWQDRVRATVRSHELYKEIADEIGESWSAEKTAAELNTSESDISRSITVKQAMDEGVTEVLEAPKFSTALNFTRRRLERKKASAMRDLRQTAVSAPAESEDDPLTITEAEVEDPGRFAEIINTNFDQWSNHVHEQPYNLIHCDFPYGVGAGDTKGQSGAVGLGGYADRPETYFNLLEIFCNRLDNFCDSSAHLVFWFSMDYYGETLESLRAAGWRVSPFPLIWLKSDNSGILPDKDRGPRRIYETAFFGSRGDRKIVRAVGNGVSTATTKDFHMSEKPRAMLHHFFRMLVDDSTRLLDPTCGSGMAVKVAEELGAEWSTGLEMNPDYAEAAKENLGL